MSGFTKLFASILDSTVWDASPEVRIVWITMLAMANRDGEVEASIPGLAKRACVERVYAEQALALFLAPDPDSRTKDHDGRRIEVIDGGWRLLNHGKYREKASAEDYREKAKARQQRLRDRKSGGTNVTSPVTRNATRDVTSRPVTPRANCHDIAEAEAEAEAEADPVGTPLDPPSTVTPKPATVGTLPGIDPPKPKRNPRSREAPLMPWTITEMLDVLRAEGGGRFVVDPFVEGLGKPLTQVIRELDAAHVTLSDISDAARWVASGGASWATDGLDLPWLATKGRLASLIGKAHAAPARAAPYHREFEDA